MLVLSIAPPVAGVPSCGAICTTGTTRQRVELDTTHATSNSQSRLFAGDAGDERAWLIGDGANHGTALQAEVRAMHSSTGHTRRGRIR
ncbi:MAG TPA: hypothetical protein VE861_00545, partial [Gemmatimonadaceae bacterium]|nr:hypothetical protein [Gemmatimonadaceae bacterium]